MVIGAALALSSSAFVLQLMSERGELATKFGSATLGILLLQVSLLPTESCFHCQSTIHRENGHTCSWAHCIYVAGMLHKINLRNGCYQANPEGSCRLGVM